MLLRLIDLLGVISHAPGRFLRPRIHGLVSSLKISLILHTGMRTKGCRHGDRKPENDSIRATIDLESKLVIANKLLAQEGLSLNLINRPYCNRRRGLPECRMYCQQDTADLRRLCHVASWSTRSARNPNITISF